MSKYDIVPEGESWAGLKALFVEMTTMLEQPRINLVELAKRYAAAAEALRSAVKAQGMSSLRFEAAVKALDLRTPKSKLEQFLDREG